MNFKKDLFEGAILKIYLNWSEQKNFRGNAVLLKREKSKEPPVKQRVYLFKEYLSRKTVIKEYYCAYQLWVIRFLDNKDKGFKTMVKIPYKYKIVDKDEED